MTQHSVTLTPPVQHEGEVVSIFKALGDPTRLRLLMHVAQSDAQTVCACHMPGLFGLSQPTISHHMSKLVDAGLVTKQMNGKWAEYTLNSSRLDVLEGFVGEIQAAR